MTTRIQVMSNGQGREVGRGQEIGQGQEIGRGHEVEVPGQGGCGEGLPLAEMWYVVLSV